MILLSILIPTLPERKESLRQLILSITKTWCPDIEILRDTSESDSTGKKRNNLLEKARGKYVWFIDDDDEIYQGSLQKVLEACKKDVDVIAIDGVMTTDGKDPIDWEIRIEHPYDASVRNGKKFYRRFPNHITPIKREHAIKVKFEDVSYQEDYKFACALKELGVLKTQEIIDQPVYHYKFISKK